MSAGAAQTQAQGRPESAGRIVIASSQPVAILLLNLGGPDSLQAVRPFLRNLFLDREIIRLPIQPILARVIARSRSRKVVERYREIGGRSPLLPLTIEQATSLERELAGEGSGVSGGRPIRVYVGMRYWRPFIREAVDDIVREGFRQILALPLFPQYSRATTGSCLNELRKVTKGRRENVILDHIDSWEDHPGYLDALAEKVEEGLATFPTGERPKVRLLFSAHSLPQEFIDEGDPYLDHLRLTIAGVMERVGDLPWVLAFQSRSGPVKWLEPSIEQAIGDLAADGCRQLLVVPVSFVSDHIETLYEIDVQYRRLALSRGIEAFRRTPSLNSSPRFITTLADLVKERLA